MDYQQILIFNAKSVNFWNMPFAHLINEVMIYKVSLFLFSFLFSLLIFDLYFAIGKDTVQSS